MDFLDLRTAFYPCCGEDMSVPMLILKDLVDRVIFCDSNRDLIVTHNNISSNLETGLPKSRFIAGSAVDVLRIIQRIDVLFYRCDSVGEGGSGELVLSRGILQMVLNRMPLSGGLIITDGSNSRQSNFEKMIRRQGLNKYGWLMQPHPTRPPIEPPDGRSYCEDKRLHVLQVTVMDKENPPEHFDLSVIYF